MCEQCGQHPRICVCDVCRPVPNSTPITIVQHPREAGHSKGTVRLLRQTLTNLSVQVAECLPPEALPQAGAALLFPGPDSQPVTSRNAAEIRHWIVLDGTWRKASRLLHLNPELAGLPAYHFADPPPGRYRIRRRPAEGQLSTAEAVRHLLMIVEPDLDTRPIDDAFEALVERLINQIPEHLRHRY
ncbi:DTW domain-containing protein [Marinobacter pelagius]|nr:DTW domain-containing protein [Marinobacter sp. C7]